MAAACLGSVNLTRFVKDPFTSKASFDWENLRKTVSIFTRMLDNVVEINGLPLTQQRDEITANVVTVWAILGLGSTLTMMGVKYGSEESLEFTDKVTEKWPCKAGKQVLNWPKKKASTSSGTGL